MKVFQGTGWILQRHVLSSIIRRGDSNQNSGLLTPVSVLFIPSPELFQGENYQALHLDVDQLEGSSELEDLIQSEGPQAEPSHPGLFSRDQAGAEVGRGGLTKGRS